MEKNEIRHAPYHIDLLCCSQQKGPASKVYHWLLSAQRVGDRLIQSIKAFCHSFWDATTDNDQHVMHHTNTPRLRLNIIA